MTDGVYGTVLLTNQHGIEASILTYGASLQKLLLPNEHGGFVDVVLGFDDDELEKYQSDINPYFGATVGRFDNRIAKGQFSLNGKGYQLAVNSGGNHLHGGVKGALSKKTWTVHEQSGNAVTLSAFSRDGEEGYLGNLEVQVTYTLTEENELQISYYAQSDQDTILNLTNHTYWNLAGHNTGSVKDQVMQIDA